jgi:hypothetical protein
MHSTLSKETDPHDIFVIEPDVVLAARADKAPSDPAYDMPGRPSAAPDGMASPASMASAASPPRVDTTFRATDVDNILGDRPATSRWAKRAFMAFLALCSAIAAAAWQYYGDDAKQMLADWTPSFVLSSSPQADKPALAGQPGAAAVPASAQAAAADQPSTQPASPAQPPAAAMPAAAEAPQTLQSMARDVAAMGQQIEQLKASIEQLKAGQEQISAKAAEIRPSEQSLRPRVSALPPRPTAPPVRKPRPAFPPPQAAAATAPPAAPASPPAAAVSSPLQPEPPARAAVTTDGEPVVRPPMPLR